MAINNRLLNNTKKFLYYINHEKYARQKEILPVKRPLKSTKQKTDKLKKTYKIIQQKNAHKKKDIRRRDKKKNKPQLKKKNKIYLLTNNLRTKRPSKKFDYRKIGLFLVKIIKKLRNTK